MPINIYFSLFYFVIVNGNLSFAHMRTIFFRMTRKLAMRYTMLFWWPCMECSLQLWMISKIENQRNTLKANDCHLMFQEALLLNQKKKNLNKISPHWCQVHGQHWKFLLFFMHLIIRHWSTKNLLLVIEIAFNWYLKDSDVVLPLFKVCVYIECVDGFAVYGKEYGFGSSVLSTTCWFE